jgi:hypothetical protein
MNKLLLLLPTILFGAGCLSSEYMGFYYPNADDLTYDIQGGPFKSLDECRDWVDGQMQVYNPTGSRIDDYECGLNCRFDKEWDGYICKETVQ